MKILLYPHCFKNHCTFCDHTCCPFFNFIFIGPFALRRCLSCFFFVTFKSWRLSSSSSSEESFSLSFSFCFYLSLSVRLFKPEPFIKSFYEPLCNLNWTVKTVNYVYYCVKIDSFWITLIFYWFQNSKKFLLSSFMCSKFD